MTGFIRTRQFAAAALALAAVAGVSAAHARTDVYFSVGVQPAGVYVQPAPVYVQPQPVYTQPVFTQPRPVYTQPRPVYSQPPVYVAPQEIYVQPAAPAYIYGYDEERAWRRDQWRHRHWRHHHRDWD